MAGFFNPTIRISLLFAALLFLSAANVRTSLGTDLPTAEIHQPADDIGHNSARLHGKVTDDGGAPAETRFRYRKKDMVPITDSLILHLDADAIEGLVDGDSISQWDDLSGKNNDATSFNGDPTYKNNVINGKPVVRFSNSPMEAWGIQFDSDFTLIVLMYPGSLSGTQSVLEQYDWNSGFGTFILRQESSEIDLAIIDGRNHTPVSGSLSGEAQIVLGEVKEDEVSVYIDGNLEVNTSHPYNILTSTKPITIGARGDTQDTHYFNGDIAEILIYDSALPDGDREEVEQYLGEKWLGWDKEWTKTSWQNSLSTDDAYHEDISGLDSGTEYEFQTQARNSAGEGSWSASESFTTLLVPHHFTLRSPDSTTAGAVIGPFTITVRGRYGGKTIVREEKTLYLDSDSGTATFYANKTGSEVIEYVTVAEGESSAQFYYSDTKEGAFSIMVEWAEPD